MGIYYKAVDELRKEFIESPKGFSIKSPGIFHPNNPFPNIVIMANHLGNNFIIVNDSGLYDDLYYDESLKDMTDYYYKMFCEYFPNYNFEKI